MSVSKFHYIYLIVFYIPLHTKTVFYQNDSETLATGVLHVSLRGLSQRSSSKSPPREGGNIANRSWKMSDAPLRGKEADTDMPDATRRGQQKSNNTHSRNSSTSSDKEAELLSQAAWAHMKDKMEDPDFLEKLASSVAETATQTATASATKAATLAATASATKAATDSATKAASVAATTDAIEQASAALRNLVNSTEFKENLSRSSGEIATNAAANYMAAQIQSEPFQMKVAEWLQNITLLAALPLTQPTKLYESFWLVKIYSKHCRLKRVSLKLLTCTYKKHFKNSMTKWPRVPKMLPTLLDNV